MGTDWLAGERPQVESSPAEIDLGAVARKLLSEVDKKIGRERDILDDAARNVRYLEGVKDGINMFIENLLPGDPSGE